MALMNLSCVKLAGVHAILFQKGSNMVLNATIIFSTNNMFSWPFQENLMLDVKTASQIPIFIPSRLNLDGSFVVRAVTNHMKSDFCIKD